jgi:hypothetical protein
MCHLSSEESINSYFIPLLLLFPNSSIPEFVTYQLASGEKNNMRSPALQIDGEDFFHWMQAKFILISLAMLLKK